MGTQRSIVRNERNGQIVGDDIEESGGLWGSFKGLMFRKSIPDGYGMVFRRRVGSTRTSCAFRST